MKQVLLCIPPDYDHEYPALGTAVLQAYLKKHKVSCLQIDLNLAYRKFLAQHVWAETELTLEEQIFFLPWLIKKFFRNCLKGRYYEDCLARQSDGIFPELPYGNNTNSSFFFCEHLLSSEYLFRYLEDEEENTFWQFFTQSGILDIIQQEDIKLVGISIISPSQAIASLTLALLIKKRFPQVHVNIGGQWPTLYRRQILEHRQLFRCFDSVIVFEGEVALLELARRVCANKEITGIANVITKDTKLNEHFRIAEIDMRRLPPPDFEGLLLGEYDGARDGQISLTFESSRGCYWGRCAYCVDLPLPKPSYRIKSAQLVVRDMCYLKDKFGASFLLLSDPGLSCRQMVEISEEIIRQGVKINWWTMARLDPGFKKEHFELAHKAGLCQINFGFETASERLSKLLDKGNLRERSSRIIRDCALSGIKVDLQTMLGLPQETYEEALETIDFLLEHKEFISHVTFNIYYLTPENYVYYNPYRYGISYDKEKVLPFSFFIPFQNLYGIDMEKAAQIEKIYYALVEKEKITSKAKEEIGKIDLFSSTETENSQLLKEVFITLLDQTVSIKYYYDEKTDTCTFLEEEDVFSQRR
ncbi:MAG: cobalamin-dependent protein [Candidatus Omnitrophica bacterium]|nr:cobalamin-dependent protein [Candidatus Omnitrophota bacterium]